MSAAKCSQLAPFEPADYLTTPERVVEYLNAVLAENDSAFLHEALEVIAKAPAMAALAGRPDAARSVADFKHRPDFEAVAHLVAAMGMKLQVVVA